MMLEFVRDDDPSRLAEVAAALRRVAADVSGGHARGEPSLQ